MLFKIAFTFAAITGLAQAGQLRATEGGNAEAIADTSSSRALTSTYQTFAFLLESQGVDGGNHYLGYHSDSHANIDKDRSKLVYHDFQLEKYDDDNRKTRKCYEMDGYEYKTYLRDCDARKKEQKWLISLAPEEYGHYYIISNAYYGYVLEYSSITPEYYLTSRSWKEVDYDQPDYIKKILFYKEAHYAEYKDQACRTSSGGQGEDGKDYVIRKDLRKDECKEYCSDDHNCEGWEFSSTSNEKRCEIWYAEPKKFSYKKGFTCYVKKY